MTDFIEIYPNALSQDFCKKFIQDFEQSPYKNEGRTGGGIDVSKKLSQDIYLNQHAEFQPALQTILQTCITHIIEYLSIRSCSVAGVAAREALSWVCVGPGPHGPYDHEAL